MDLSKYSTFSVLALPSFARLADQPITMELFMQQGFWVGLGALFLVGTFLSGLYPAMVLSSYKPIDTLKGGAVSGSRGAWLRKGLVVFQFMASVGLIIGTYTVYEQISNSDRYQIQSCCASNRFSR